MIKDLFTSWIKERDVTYASMFDTKQHCIYRYRNISRFKMVVTTVLLVTILFGNIHAQTDLCYNIAADGGGPNHGFHHSIQSEPSVPYRIYFCQMTEKMLAEPTTPNIQPVARVVYGESRGEPLKGQLAVAYTIVNRISHAGYPSTLSDVAYQKTANNKYQYETLDLKTHDKAWKNAVMMKDFEYGNAIHTAIDALCKGKTDPTTCATDFCAVDPCPATSSNAYWTVYNKMKIGAHWFVCRRAKSG